MYHHNNLRKFLIESSDKPGIQIKASSANSDKANEEAYIYFVTLSSFRIYSIPPTNYSATPAKET